MLGGVCRGVKLRMQLDQGDLMMLEMDDKVDWDEVAEINALKVKGIPWNESQLLRHPIDSRPREHFIDVMIDAPTLQTFCITPSGLVAQGLQLLNTLVLPPLARLTGFRLRPRPLAIVIETLGTTCLIGKGR